MVLDMVRTARKRGLQAPVLFMGYYNPLLQYGEERMLKDTREAGASGFIMVDLPPEEAVRFRDLCTSNGYVPFTLYWISLSNILLYYEDCHISLLSHHVLRNPE